MCMSCFDSRQLFLHWLDQKPVSSVMKGKIHLVEMLMESLFHNRAIGSPIQNSAKHRHHPNTYRKVVLLCKATSLRIWKESIFEK